MIGLSGCFWAGPLTPQIAGTAQRLRRAVTVSRHGPASHDDGPFFRVSVTTNRVEPQEARRAQSADGAVSLFFDGWVERPAAARGVSPAAYALQRFLEDGSDGLRRMNGIYNIVVCELPGRRAQIVSSRHSYLPVFYISRGSALFFAPEIRALLAAGICEPEIVDHECMAWLLFGRYLRGETKLRDVKLLPCGSGASWSDGILEIDTLPSFQYRDDGGVVEERLVDDLAETFRAAVRRRTDEEERIALGLSGGFDSRLILSAIAKRKRGDVFAFTWGDAGNDDMRIAGKVAREAGVEHHNYAVGHRTYLERARDGVWQSDGLSLFVHGFYPYVSERVRQDAGAHAAFNGVGLDVLLGGLFLDIEVLDGIATRRDLLAHYRQKLVTFTREEFGHLCKAEGKAGFDDALATLEDVIADIPGERIADVNDQFHFETRTRRWIALAFPLVRPSLETVAPCYDDEFLGVLAQVQPAQRFNRRLYVKLLARMSPELSRIEYQKTMVPACVPSDHWRPFVELEQQKELAHYALWKHSGGTVYVPYKHYPQNFVEWFCVHADWQEFLRGTLLGAESVLIERYFEKRALQALIDDHVEGRRNWFRQLTLLVSLELFLQLFGRHAGIEPTFPPLPTLEGDGTENRA